MKKEMEMFSSPIAEPCTERAEQGKRAWYCVRTHLKHEHIAAGHLNQVAGVEAFNPQIRVLRSTRQGRRWFMESLFPNYVFARCDLEAMWAKISYASGVKVVLRFGGRAPEIPEAVIEELRQEVAALGATVLTDAPMEGDEVEIASGAFAGMKAAVTRVLPGKQRAQILVEVMGRMVPAELSLDMVLFNRHDAAQFALPPTGPAPPGNAGWARPMALA